MGHQAQHPCLLCGVAIIHKTKKYGFEAAHIVAWRYSRNVSDPYLLIPSCSTCNNEMGDANLFDWLLSRARHQALREIAWTIYQCYCAEFPNEHRNSIVHVFRRLYGTARFPAGDGGISNRKVYHMLQQLQLSKIHERQRVLAQEQEMLARRSTMIMDESVSL